MSAFIREHLCGFGASALLAAGTAAINAICILMLIPMLDHLTGKTVSLNLGLVGSRPILSVEPTMSMMLFTYVGLAVLLGAVQMSRTCLDGSLVHTFCFDLRNRFYEAVCRADWAAQSQLRQADLAHAIVSECDRVQRGTAAGLTLLSNVVLVAGLLLVAVYAQPLVALLAIACAAVAFPLLYLPNRKSRQAGHLYSERCRDFFQDSLEQLAALKESKILGSEDRHLERFRRLAGDLKQVGTDQQRALGLTNLIFAVSGAMIVSVTVLAGMVWIRSSIAQLTVVLLTFVRLAPRLRTMQIQYQLMVTAAPALHTVHELQRELSMAAENRDPPSDGSPVELQTAMEIRQLHYRYPTQHADTIDALSAHIPARTLVTITGASGAGKSTLIDLLTGLLEPDSGEILVDGKNLHEYSLPLWRETCGYVPQHSFLLNTTIEHNLRWARPEATAAELTAALQKADLTQFDQSDSSGLDFQVGDRGSRLSGGERQRLNLARALLRHPSLLLLDEPTSSLDPDTAQRIWQTLKNLSRDMTVIVVTHQTQYCHLADSVLHLEGGRVLNVSRNNRSHQSQDTGSSKAA
ncbi:MAG: ABC transporter ATP-binding protein [Fuerstiella sp.]